MAESDRVEILFEQLRVLDGPGRAHLLASLRLGDPETADEIESLIEFDGQGERLASLVDCARAGLDEAAAPLEGRAAGPYRILRLVGRGGMGDVYEAVREQDFRLRAAVKVASARVGVAHWVARLESERRILAELNHPHIARLLDGGTLGDGRPWLAMEFVEGEPVTAHVRKRRLPVEERVRLFRKICEAVSHAHERLVIHRDLKPDNILVSEDGMPHLLDFGIAKLLPGPGLEPDATTPFATLAYCSPEQARAEAVTTRSDVYSLGVILFEMLTEKDAWTEGPLSPQGMLDAAGRKGELAATGLDPDLDVILRTATRRDPEDRFGSVFQLSADLGRFLEGLPVEARPPSLSYRAAKFARRHRVELALAGVAVLVLLAGALVFLREARRAERRFQMARRLANVLATDIYDQVNSMPGAVALRAKVAATSTEYLDALSREAGSDPELRLELASGYARLAESKGGNRSTASSSEGMDAASRGLALLDGLPDRYRERARPIEAELRLHRGFALRDESRFREGIAELERSVELSRGCDAADARHCQLPMAFNGIAQQAAAVGDWALAGSAWERSLAALERARPALTEARAEAWELLAASAELRILRDGRKDRRAALRAGERLLPQARAAVEAPEQGVRLTDGKLFLWQFAATVNADPAAPAGLRREVLEWLWRAAEKDAARDPGNVRAMSEQAGAAQELGFASRAGDPAAAAGWFARALDLQLAAARLGGLPVTRQIRLWECGRDAIRGWLAAGEADRALAAARAVSELEDPDLAFRPKLPLRPVEARELQAYWWTAALATESRDRAAARLWREAEQRAEKLAAGGARDPATLAAVAAVFDGLGDSGHRRRADALWGLVAVAVPENAWLQRRLAEAGRQEIRGNRQPLVR